MWRNPLRTFLPLLVVALLALPTAAQASPNNAPSTAANVQLGKPFTGNWPGTVYQHGEEQFTHWWRLPVVMRPGDQIQLAVDNRLGDRTVGFCLVQPIDDFGADAALGGCSYSSVGEGQQSRMSITYSGASGQAFLVASRASCCMDRGETAEYGGQYTVTIEQFRQLVNIGFVVPPALPASFTLGASVVYGDNTPVVDGVPAVLQWRPVAPRGTDPAPFASLVHSVSVGGVVTFAGAMPVAAQGERVQLRACVGQPGGLEVRCGASGRTLVAESACSRALDNQLVLARVVHRLARHVRRLRAGPAKLRLKRKLKAKKRKLAKANRSVKVHCG